MSSRKLRIGKIVGFHGLRGDAKVRCSSESPDWLGSLKHVELVLGERREVLVINSAKPRGERMVLLRFKGLPDRTAVEPWLNAELYVDEADLPAPEEGEYRADSLIGLTVVDHQTGRIWGTVRDLLNASGSDFLEIALEDKRETVVIPFNNHFFPVVDLEKAQIHVALLADFLQDAAGAEEKA